ncbi:putative WD domain, G-beta repeat [Trypanosoma cruzi]|nr:putative WD domain, G-beta repeat [Trypanosoma cruzi]
MGCGASRNVKADADVSLTVFDPLHHGVRGRGLVDSTQRLLENGEKVSLLRGGGDDDDEENEVLSDITIELSTRSCRSGVTCGSFLFREDEFVRQCQEVPLSIEEDLFVYDDVVVSKNEAQTKHWRIEGRRPLASRRVSTRLKGGGPSDNLFHFTDFNICVDEVDLAADQQTGDGVLRQLSIQEGAQQAVLLGATVVRTFSAAPNTVAAMLRTNEPMSRKEFSRLLREIQVETFIGHASRVKCISVFPKERSFVSCSSEEASVTLRSLVTGKEEGIFTGHRDLVICTAVSPDGKYLATTSKDQTMLIWDAIITKVLHILRHGMVVICCCFSPDSNTVVSGCQDRVCRLWDVRKGKERVAYSKHAGIIVSVAFSPDGNYVCSTSADRTLHVWSATTGNTYLKLNGHVGIVLACSYTSDGQYIISNDETHLCVWSAADGSCQLRLAVTELAGKTRGTSRAGKLAWTSSCAAPGAFTRYMAVACTNRFVYILDICNGSEKSSVFCKAPVYCLTGGYKEKIAFGDNFGNLYVQTLL